MHFHLATWLQIFDDEKIPLIPMAAYHAFSKIDRDFDEWFERIKPKLVLATAR